jgi:Lhr-like helicase
VFTLAGRQLELVMIKDMTVLVRKSNAKKVDWCQAWLGGRLPLSASLGGCCAKNLMKRKWHVERGSQRQGTQNGFRR